ncbi:ABC transporter permease, partial [Candidatus Pelagibacter sp.]|nr:ABC transporter permease [Candidatus Pelagibacter sp.]
MISALEKEITLRYIKTRKKDGFLNIISIFSFIGISLGVAVLIIVMSVMNGFRTELINKIVGFNAHVTVKPYESTISLEKLDNENLKLISKDLILSNSGEAIVISKDYTKGLILRGYSNENYLKLDVVKKGNLIGKSNQLTKNSISIGKELSFNLDLSVGDKISIMSSVGIDTIIGSLPKQETFIISSIFNSGLVDFDANIAFINLDTLENFFSLKKEKRNLEIYLKTPSNIDEAKTKIQKIFKNEFVYSWADMNSSLFSALKIERNVMFIILSLIIIV